MAVRIALACTQRRCSSAWRASFHCSSQLEGSLGQRCSSGCQGMRPSSANRACTAALLLRFSGN